jgi:hypothetical protein
VSRPETIYSDSVATRKRWINAKVIVPVALIITTIAGLAINRLGDRAYEADLQAIEQFGIARNDKVHMARITGSTKTAGLYRALSEWARTEQRPTEERAWYAWRVSDGVASGEKLKKPYLKVVPLIEEIASSPPPNYGRDWSEGYAMLMPEVGAPKIAAKFLMTEAILRAAKKDVKGSIHALEQIDVLFLHALHEPSIVSSIVAHTICHIYWVAAREILALFADDPRAVDALRRAFDARPPIPSIRFALSGEYLMSRATVANKDFTGFGPEIVRSSACAQSNRSKAREEVAILLRSDAKR